jgi:hypothetical protein
VCGDTARWHAARWPADDLTICVVGRMLSSALSGLAGGVVGDIGGADAGANAFGLPVAWCLGGPPAEPRANGPLIFRLSPTPE